MDVQARATYRIEALGGLSVAGGAGPLTGAATQRKTMLLLAVLAAAGSQGTSRERLLALFWPESDTERARHALKQALHILRRDLREPELLLGTPVLRLNPDVITCDVQEFEQALAAGELERAAALYRGSFLDGLWLDGTLELERWIEGERARLARSCSDALGRLASAAAASGDLAGAVGWWRRLASMDPLSSRVAVALMQALAAAGEPEAALQHARVYETLVREELDAAPDPAVTALAQQLRSAPREAPRPAATARAATPPPTESAAEMASVMPAALVTPASVEHERPLPVATPVPAPVPTPVAAPPGRRHRHMAIGLAAALVLVATSTMIARRAGGPASARVVAAAPRSVAVLPFVDMSAGGENAYLGDGLADELIAALGRVEGLSVAARTSSFALRDARLDVRTIADTLGVAAVVEGSVRRAGDRVRVTAQLVDARSGYRLWSEEYDLEVHDALAVQEEIATAIAGALRLTMDPAAGASHGRTANREAWNLYLHANFLRNRLARTELLKALENFDRAIALDSSFARAWSGKAQTLVTLVHLRGVPRDSGLAAARAAALRAMALDDRLAEPHATLGAMSMGLAWDWPAAGRELRRAIEVEPSDAFSHNVLANYYRIMGRQDLALVERQRAAALDPLNPRIAVGLGGDYYAMGQYERALAQFRRSADLDSMSSHLLGTGPRLPGAVGQVLERLGREDEAVDWYVSVARRRGAAPGEQDALRRAHATGGMRAFWHAWLAFDRRTAKVDDTRPLREAAILARAGDVDAAIPVLERAYAERDPALIYIGVEEPWVALRDDPRIASIRRRMKLPE